MIILILGLRTTSFLPRLQTVCRLLESSEQLSGPWPGSEKKGTTCIGHETSFTSSPYFSHPYLPCQNFLFNKSCIVCIFKKCLKFFRSKAEYKESVKYIPQKFNGFLFLEWKEKKVQRFFWPGREDCVVQSTYNIFCVKTKWDHLNAYFLLKKKIYTWCSLWQCTC